MRYAIAILSAALLAGGALALAEEPAGKPAKAPKPPKVVQPWAKVPDLSEDQKAKLIEIHEEITDKINALRKEEEERSSAVLTDAQKEKLKEILATEKAARKVKDAGKKAAESTGGPK